MKHTVSKSRLLISSHLIIYINNDMCNGTEMKHIVFCTYINFELSFAGNSYIF